MKRYVFTFVMILLLAAAITAFAEEELYWSNFNSDPVKNGPKYYGTFSVAADHAPLLITHLPLEQRERGGARTDLCL